MQTKRDYLYLTMSFFLPFTIMGIAFAMVGVYPFGEWQIMIIDFAHQYYPFLSDYWHKLREGSSLLWSWTSGGGINYLSRIAYNLASPLNLLIVLFPHEWLREVLTVMILVKIGLSGLFFAMYLRYSFKRCDLTLPIFSLFYALCAFALGYYWNIMYLDTFALLPLVVLGIHALVREGKWRLYIAALALSFFCNYYMGLFTCIFSAIMFFALCITEKVSKPMLLQKLARITICSAIAIGLTAVLTIPALLSLQNTQANAEAFPAQLRNLESYVDILGNFIAFTPPTILDGLPNLYCGMLSILLLGVFIRSEKIDLRIKIVYAAILVFLIVSLNLNVLNFIWHGFRFPIDVPYRFSFLVSFTIVLMAYYAYCSMDEVDWRDVLAMAASSIFFHVFATFGTQNPMFMGAEGYGTLTEEDIFSSAALSAAFILLFALRIPMRQAVQTKDQEQHSDPAQTDNKIRERVPFISLRVFAPLLFVLVVFELVMVSHLGVASIGSALRLRASYPELYDNVQGLLEMREPETDPIGFSRTEFTNRYTLNDPALYRYDGISIFSSTLNRNIAGFMYGLGFNLTYHMPNRYVYFKTTPVADAFLNVRYMINRSAIGIDDSVYWERVGDYAGSLLYENKYYLPLGFMVSQELAGYTHEENNPFRNQSEVFKSATGLDGNLFSPVDLHSYEYAGYDVTMNNYISFSCTLHNNIEEAVLQWNYKVPNAGPLYLYLSLDSTLVVQGAQITIDGEWIRNHVLGIDSEVFYAGTFDEGDIVSVVTIFDEGLHAIFESMSLDEAITGNAVIYAMQINHELFERGYDILSAETLELTEFSDTRVKGTVYASKDGLLYTSIPYENGWRAYVNSVETEITLIDGAMLAVPLSAGEHEVEFRYFPAGLTAGIIVSIISLLAVTTMVISDKRMGRSKINAC